MYLPATRSLLYQGTPYSWTPRDIPGPPENVPVVVPAEAELLIRQAVSILLAQLGDDFVIPPHASSTLPIPAPEIDLIDREVRRLRSAMLAVTHEFGQRITSWSRKRNSLAVFGRLPPELSSEILGHSFRVPTGEYEYEQGSMGIRRLRELASVSSEWFSIVKSCPTLWTTIDINARNLSHVALKLRKSGALPLTISGAWDENSLPEYTEVVMSNCHRWGSAEIEISRDLLRRISRRLEAPMPLLQSLILVQAGGWGEKGIDPIRITGSDGFHTLELNRVRLHQDSPVLKTVRKIQIRNTVASNTFAVLASTTQLESLYLGGIDEEDLAGYAAAGMPTVQLPRLRSLELTGVTSLAVIGLMNGIRWEDLTVLRISMDDKDNTDHLLSQLMESRRSILTSIITPHMKAVKFHIWSDDMLEITGEAGESRRVDISLQVLGVTEWFSTAESFRVFARRLPDAEVVMNDDSAPADSAVSPWNLAFLLEMPSVVSIEIASRRRLIREVFTNILRKSRGACPRLTVVRISDPGILDKDWGGLCGLMEKALRRRKEASPALPPIVVYTEREVPGGGYIVSID